MKRPTHRLLAAFGAVGLAATVLGSAGAAHAADGDYTNPVNGHTSTYTSVDDYLTWPDARDAAAATPAPAGCTNHLAVITSQAEQTFLTEHVTPGDQWLGGARTESGAPFAWVTGEAFDYTSWNEGEPNDTTPGEPYIQLTPSGRWNDIFAFAVTSGYILETECPQRPVISMVAPGSGPATGGNEVTLTGTGFTGAKQVTFGGTRATSYTVESDTSIVVTVPAYTGDVGRRGKSVQVRVQTRGSNVKTAIARYRYLPAAR